MPTAGGSAGDFAVFLSFSPLLAVLTLELEFYTLFLARLALSCRLRPRLIGVLSRTLGLVATSLFSRLLTSILGLGGDFIWRGSMEI